MGKTSCSIIKIKKKVENGGAGQACAGAGRESLLYREKTKQIFHNRPSGCGKLSGIFAWKPGSIRRKYRQTPGSVYRTESTRQNCIQKSNSTHSTATTVSCILSGSSSTVKRTVSPAKAMP